MTDSLTGALGPPILAGQVLDQAAVFEEDIRERRIKAVPVLANGDRREVHVHSGAGFPLQKVKRDVTLRYQHLRGHLDLVEEILSAPGPHDLVVWKRIHPSFAGNGWRKEFFLYHRIANHLHALPSTLPSAPLAVEVRVGLAGAALTVLEKSQVDYDAGSPASTEAWFLDGGEKFKLGAAPADGARVYLRMVPILEMFEDVETERRYRAGTIREPRDIQLVEA